MDTDGFMLYDRTSFGNINLGETFRGLVVAANDSGYEVFDPMLRVEMQTANTRVMLWDSTAATGDPQDSSAQGMHTNQKRSLRPGECLEAPMLEYEIKEPGLHALTCSVSYWSPPSQAPFLDPSKADERINRAFRKLYKFQVSELGAASAFDAAERPARSWLDSTPMLAG